MRPDLIGPVGSALAAVGVGLQFVRAYTGRKFDELILVIGILSALGLWALAVDWAAITDYPQFIILQVPVAATLISSMFGGIFGASKVASGIAARDKSGQALSHPLVPVTGSMGGTK